jgi:hypothetical protein
MYHRIVLDAQGVLRRLDTSWAVDLLGELAFEDPDRCWSIAKEVFARQPPEDVLTTLGALLGTLFGQHPTILAAVRQDVEGDPTTAELVSWTMADDQIDAEVWAEIERLSARA